MPAALRDGLRTGLRFGDWIRAGLARGPIYHADMGPDYAIERLATRREERTEREHKHADGRWVRIREGRMPDGGRVILTVDVTARREAEEALKQQRGALPRGRRGSDGVHYPSPPRRRLDLRQRCLLPASWVWGAKFCSAASAVMTTFRPSKPGTGLHGPTFPLTTRA